MGSDEPFDMERGIDLDEKTAEKIEKFIEDAEREGMTVTSSCPPSSGGRG